MKVPAAEDLFHLLPHRGAIATDLCRGCRVTGIPTATVESNGLERDRGFQTQRRRASIDEQHTDICSYRGLATINREAQRRYLGHLPKALWCQARAAAPGLR